MTLPWNEPDKNMPLFRKKSREEKEAELFTKDFTELLRQIVSALRAAQSAEEAAPHLKMLEGLASHGMPQAQTFHGLAYMMDDKPWYDSEKGFGLLKGAAEGDDPQTAFSKHELGKVYLQGRKDIEPDPVSGRYWIGMAAEMGYAPAVEEMRSRWG